MAGGGNIAVAGVNLRFSDALNPNFNLGDDSHEYVYLEQTNHLPGTEPEIRGNNGGRRQIADGQLQLFYTFNVPYPDDKIYKLVAKHKYYNELIVENINGNSIANFTPPLPPYLITNQVTGDNFFVLQKQQVGTVSWAIYGNGLDNLAGLQIQITQNNTVVYQGYNSISSVCILASNQSYNLVITCPGYQNFEQELFIVEYGYIHKDIRLISLNSDSNVTEKGPLSFQLWSKDFTTQHLLPVDTIIASSSLSPKSLICSDGYREPRKCEITLAKNDFFLNHFVLSSSKCGDFGIKVFKGNTLVLTGFSSTDDAMANPETIELIIYDFSAIFSIFEPSIELEKKAKQDFQLLPAKQVLLNSIQTFFNLGGFEFNFNQNLPELHLDISSIVNQIIADWSNDGQYYTLFSSYKVGFLATKQSNDEVHQNPNYLVVYRATKGKNDTYISGYKTLKKNADNTISVYNGSRHLMGKNVTLTNFETDFAIKFENQSFDGGVYQAVIPSDPNNRTCYCLYQNKVYKSVVNNFDELLPIKTDVSNLLELIKTILYAKSFTVYCQNDGQLMFIRKDMLANNQPPLISGRHFAEAEILSQTIKKAEIEQTESFESNIASSKFFDRIKTQLIADNNSINQSYKYAGEFTKLATQNISLGQKIRHRNKTFIIISVSLDPYDGLYTCQYLTKG